MKPYAVLKRKKLPKENIQRMYIKVHRAQMDSQTTHSLVKDWIKYVWLSKPGTSLKL
jgi:hypothetical protein